MPSPHSNNLPHQILPHRYCTEAPQDWWPMSSFWTCVSSRSQLALRQRTLLSAFKTMVSGGRVWCFVMITCSLSCMVVVVILLKLLKVRLLSCIMLNAYNGPQSILVYPSSLQVSMPQLCPGLLLGVSWWSPQSRRIKTNLTDSVTLCSVS